MAVLKRFVCVSCGEPTQESRPSSDYSNICTICNSKAKDKKRRDFLAQRAALSIEERLRLLELWTYDYKPPINILDTVFG